MYRGKLAMDVRADVCDTARSENVHPQVLPDADSTIKKTKIRTLIAIQIGREKEGEPESRRDRFIRAQG